MSLLGREIVNFTVTRRLGHGDAPAAYLAEHGTLGARCVFKVLRGSRALAERAAREARLLRDLDHPTIGGVLNAGWLDDDRYFYQLELVGGLDLRSHLKARGALPVDRVIAMLDPVIEALALAHRAGLAHRGLHPGNLMLPSDGADPPRLRLLDLGVAKRLESERRPSLAVLPFAAPEQLRDASRAGRAADVYGLGATVYAAVSGRAPFESKSRAELVAAVQNEAPPPLPQVAPRAPRALGAVLSRCLAKDPAERPRTIEAAWTEICAAAGGRGRRRSATAPASRERRAEIPAAAYAAAYAAAFVAAAVLGLFAAWLVG